MSDRRTAECSRGAVATWRTVVVETLAGGPLARAVPIAGAVLLLLFPMLSGDPYWISEISRVAVLALVVSGLNLTFGFVGELQFAQVFTFGLGCYVTMILASRGDSEILILLPIGAVSAIVGAVVISLPAIRVSGWALALTSFFFVVTIPELVAVLHAYTGGLNGLVDIAEPRLFGITLGTTGLYEVTVAAMIIWFALYRNLVTSRFGVVFRVLRQSPVLASSIGYSPPKLKAMTYALAAVPTGIGGCLFGFVSLVVTPSLFDVTLAIGILAASVLGGAESVYGAVIGAAVIELGPQHSLTFHEYAPIAYGLFLVLAAVLLRGGLASRGSAMALWLSRALVPQGNDIAPPESILSTPALLGPLTGAVLKADSLSVAFGGVHALERVSLTANPGQVTGVIGANGSGKTTLLNAVCGYVTADAASAVTLGGSDITGAGASSISRSGVARTFQTPLIPQGVSVVDVVASGRYVRDRRGLVSSVLRLPSYRRSRRADEDEALLMLSIVGLSAQATAQASELPLGSRRLVEVARALCARPRVLLLDEPASGLSVSELDRLALVVRLVAHAGATVVLIDHNVGFVASAADVTHALHLGRLIASEPSAGIQQNRAVAESYFGPPALDPRATADDRGPAAIRPPSLEHRRSAARSELTVAGVEAGYGDLTVLRGVTVRPQPGAVEVVLGRNGVGKTTLLGAIAGVVRVREGTVALDGRDITGLAAHRRAAAGIALVQEGKRVFRQRTVMENVRLGTFTQPLSRRDRAALCEAVLGQFPMLAERARDLAGHLSGGQLQMLAIAQALAARPRVLLLDEPSAGLAPVVAAELFQRIRRLATDGMTIVLVEQLAAEAVAIADHITVLNGGRVVSSGPADRFRDDEVLRAAYLAAGAPDVVPSA